MEGATITALDIATDLGLSIGVAAYHVRQLHRAGVLSVARTEQRRGAIQNHYASGPLLVEAGDVARAAALALSVEDGGSGAQLRYGVRTLDQLAQGVLAEELARLDQLLEELETASAARAAGDVDQRVAVEIAVMAAPSRIR